MEEKKLWELLGKKITGEADASELEELNRLLEKFPEALYTLENMEHYWRSTGEKADILQRETALDRHLLRLPVATPVPISEAGSSGSCLHGLPAADPCAPEKGRQALHPAIATDGSDHPGRAASNPIAGRIHCLAECRDHDPIYTKARNRFSAGSILNRGSLFRSET